MLRETHCGLLSVGQSNLVGGATNVPKSLVALLLLSARKRGLRAGGWTLLLWHYFALAAVLGFLRPAGDPLALISGHELPHGAAARAPMEAEAC